jgi:hypothetical protein
MRWKIQIEGDEKYLDDLSNIFRTLNFDPKIYKDSKDYYLEGSIFEKLRDAKEVSATATTFLALVPVVFNFKTERAIEPLKVVGFSYEEGDFKYGFDPKANLLYKAPIGDVVLKPQDMVHSSRLISDSATGSESIQITQYDNKGEIIGGLNTIEEINNYIKTNSNSESLENIAKYLKPSLEKLFGFSSKFPNETPTKDIVKAELEYRTNIELAKWATLRKIYETIRDDKYFANTKFTNGINFIYDAIGKESAGNFYRTASNKQVHSETTVIKMKYKEPTHEMPLSEAEELISILLSKYIEEKVKGGAI